MALLGSVRVVTRLKHRTPPLTNPSLLGWRPSLLGWRPSRIETKKKEKEARSQILRGCHRAGTQKPLLRSPRRLSLPWLQYTAQHTAAYGTVEPSEQLVATTTLLRSVAQCKSDSQIVQRVQD